MRYVVEIEDLDKLKRALERVQSALYDAHPLHQGELPSLESEEVYDCLSEIEYMLLGLEPISPDSSRVLLFNECKKDITLIIGHHLSNPRFKYVRVYCDNVAMALGDEDLPYLTHAIRDAEYTINHTNRDSITMDDDISLDKLSGIMSKLLEELEDG